MTNTLAYYDTDLITTLKSTSGFAQVGFGLACNYLTWVEVTDNDKHSSLLQ